jgi:hypothetical protein
MTMSTAEIAQQRKERLAKVKKKADLLDLNVEDDCEIQDGELVEDVVRLKKRIKVRDTK